MLFEYKMTILFRINIAEMYLDLRIFRRRRAGAFLDGFASFHRLVEHERLELVRQASNVHLFGRHFSVYFLLRRRKIEFATSKIVKILTLRQ